MTANNAQITEDDLKRARCGSPLLGKAIVVLKVAIRVLELDRY